MRLIRELWQDDLGFIISAELVLVATILVLGMIVGLVTIRDQVTQELGDVAAAFSQLVQSYSFSGVTGHTSQTAGSEFVDATDFCDGDEVDPSGLEPACISVQVDASVESL
jgi:hypothetical protein